MKTECPHCKAIVTIPKGYPIHSEIKCSKCQNRFVPEAVRDDTKAKPLTKVNKAKLGNVFLAICLVVFIGIYAKQREEIGKLGKRNKRLSTRVNQLVNQLTKEKPEKRNEPITKRQITTKSPEVDNSPRRLFTGERGYLHSGVGQVVLGVDKKTLKEMNAAVIAKDTFGLDKLIKSGRIFTVPDGTKILMLDSGWSFLVEKVRILDGKYRGKAGWVPYERVRK